MKLGFCLSDQETVEFLSKNKEFITKLLNKNTEEVFNNPPLTMHPPFKMGEYPIDGWRNQIIQLILELQENNPHYLSVINSFIHLLPDHYIEKLLRKFASYDYWKLQLWSSIEIGISNLLECKNMVAAKFYKENRSYLLDVDGSVNITLVLNKKDYIGDFERLMCGILPKSTIMVMPYSIKIDPYHRDYLAFLDVHLIQRENGVICKIPATSNSDVVELVGNILLDMAKIELGKIYAEDLSMLVKQFKLIGVDYSPFDINNLLHVLVENQKEEQPLKIEYFGEVIVNSIHEFGIEVVLDFLKM